VKRICTICARGGSKGVKNKNIRLLEGKPLIAHTIAHAKESGCFEGVVVSSDSDEILSIARDWGADYSIKRPDALANDTAAKIPAIKHALLEAEKIYDMTFDTFVDLDATSPLRFAVDVENAINLLESNQVSSVITGAPARRSPYFNLVERTQDGRIALSKKLEKPVVRRQDSPQCYDMNASIYVWNRNRFLENPTVFYTDTLLYEMPEDRSQDIDCELDFKIVELIMNERQ